MEGIRREGFLPRGDWVSKLDLDEAAGEGEEFKGGSRLGVDMMMRDRVGDVVTERAFCSQLRLRVEW